MQNHKSPFILCGCYEELDQAELFQIVNAFRLNILYGNF